MKPNDDAPYCNNCRAKWLTNGVWECLAEDPRRCPNALEFGLSHHICRHPDPQTLTNNIKPKVRPEY